jgi:hypothetical protein
MRENFMLTPETKLLIQHWAAVEEIIRANDNLHVQLTELLLSIGSDLTKKDWWSEKWNFVDRSPGQVFIAHNHWRYEKTNYAIWIGIEGFCPSALFGKETFQFAQLYVYTPLGDKEFISEIRQLFRGRKIRGSVEEKCANYIIKDFLPKILPSQSDDFEMIVRDRVIEFFSFFAKEETGITEIVTRQLVAK